MRVCSIFGDSGHRTGSGQQTDDYDDGTFYCNAARGHRTPGSNHLGRYRIPPVVTAALLAAYVAADLSRHGHPFSDEWVALAPGLRPLQPITE
jgi:hypothetical protein